MNNYTIGIDYGTSSVRSVIVDCSNGVIVGSSIYNYPHGVNGVMGNKDPNTARQHPDDYIEGLKETIKGAIKEANIEKKYIRAIGIDATASTPIPLDVEGIPLAFNPDFNNNLSAMAWLWKDHTSVNEANEITMLAKDIRPHYLTACGGTYSSEWYWSKILHCLRNFRDVFDASDSWMELQDWIPFLLTGNRTSGLCAAGHKGLYSPSWNGYPDDEFLGRLDKALIKIRTKLPSVAKNLGQIAGYLNNDWSKELSLPEGIPVAVGTIDAHAGAIGSGISAGVMVKILGTSTCDIAITPITNKLPEIPGICGIAYESVLPGYYGIEAGQSAVGDIFDWYVNKLQPDEALDIDELSSLASKIKPGSSGLLALDWNNGNRSILADPLLSGLLIGTTLQTSVEQIFIALIEATAFGARMIIERYQEYDININRVINCGGIAVKSPLIMQIYADVLGRSMEISSNEQSCALGAAMAGSVVGGIHKTFEIASDLMIGVNTNIYSPKEENQQIYNQLFKLYKQLHNGFGLQKNDENMYNIMKDLIKIRKQVSVGEES
ncbi:MAG: ribulokinase [Pontiellaceae bacterium]